MLQHCDGGRNEDVFILGMEKFDNKNKNVHSVMERILCQNMWKRNIMLMFCLICSVAAFPQASDYYARQAQSCQREAAYYMRQAESYQREADFYNRQAQRHLRDAEYYTRQKKYDRAKTYRDRAGNATDKALAFSRKASNARDKAAGYMKKADAMMRKNKR